MYIQKFLGILILTIIISSCGANSIPTNSLSGSTASGAKTPFLIKTVRIGSGGLSAQVEKTGRISASSSLTLVAQGAGEIATLNVKEGQSIKAGGIIATLKDTQNNYDLRFAQAQNALKIQEATIQTTKINLEQSVENARIAYERARQSLETLTGKNTLNYDTLVNTNTKTLDAYNENYKTYLSDTDKTITQVLYEGDKILGISTKYQYTNDSWEPYLGAQLTNTRTDAISKWNKLSITQNDLAEKIKKSKTINSNTSQEDLDFISETYSNLQSYIDSMVLMLQNNIITAGLSGDMNTGWNTAWSGYRGSVQSSQATYNAWKGQTITFFKGYKNTEIANKLALASISRSLTPEEQKIIKENADIRVTFENAKIDFKDKIENAKLSLEQAKQGYDTAIALRDATLIQLAANTENAKLSLEQAERDYNKLRVIAPVDGNISKVIGNIGQSVNNGSPVVEFIGKQPQMIIDIDPALISELSVGQSVPVLIDGSITMTGIISALSNVSNANLLSTVRIAIKNAQSHIGKSATVILSNGGKKTIENTRLSLPMSAVKIISENEGEVYVINKSGSLMQKTVLLGSAHDSMIEISSGIDKSDIIIISNMENYATEKYVLKIESEKVQ